MDKPGVLMVKRGVEARIYCLCILWQCSYIGQLHPILVLVCTHLFRVLRCHFPASPMSEGMNAACNNDFGPLRKQQITRSSCLTPPLHPHHASYAVSSYHTERRDVARGWSYLRHREGCSSSLPPPHLRRYPVDNPAPPLHAEFHRVPRLEAFRCSHFPQVLRCGRKRRTMNGERRVGGVRRGVRGG